MPEVDLAPPDLVTGNPFDKYRTRNPLYQRLMQGFLRSARELLNRAAPKTVIEAGCGPGDLAHWLFEQDLASLTFAKPSYVGTDISEEEVATARQQFPALEFRIASIYSLPFPDASADLVLACEVLEHLDEPSQALAELARVSREYVLISVPWEPIWRALNLMRGKYVTRLGNSLGHVQHFSRAAIKRLVSTKFEIVAVETPFPWTMILARKRG